MSWSIWLVGIRSRPVKDRGTQDQRCLRLCLLWMRVYQYRHVLESTPPLPTHPSVLTMSSVLVMTASGSTMTMPTTPTKGGATPMTRIGSVRKWGVRRRRETSSMPSEVLGGLFLTIQFFLRSFSNLSFLPSAESKSQEAPDHTPRPRTSMSSLTRELSTSAFYPSTPNGTSSAADTQHTHTHWCVSSFQWHWQPRRFFLRMSSIKRARQHRSQ